MNKSPERKFIHDLANPLGTALFVLDAYLNDLPKNSAEHEPLRKVISALEKMRLLMSTRREELIKAETPQ